jgi:hypothetical protein
MRASVHIKVPNLTSDGTDTKAKEICGPLGLSVRGTGGEHAPSGADGTIDLSPRARLYIKESEIVAKLYQGIQDLMKAEQAAGGAPPPIFGDAFVKEPHEYTLPHSLDSAVIDRMSILSLTAISVHMM